jgi:hypothetical protein
VDDLSSLDTQLAHGLNDLKAFKGDVEKELSLNFTVTEGVVEGKPVFVGSASK